jgi:hypothetical protein
MPKRHKVISADGWMRRGVIPVNQLESDPGIVSLLGQESDQRIEVRVERTSLAPEGVFHRNGKSLDLMSSAV